MNYSGITKLTVENDITIPNSSYNNCAKLKEIIIGDNVIINGAYGVFNKCAELTKVTMGKNIKITNMWSENTEPKPSLEASGMVPGLGFLVTGNFIIKSSFLPAS